MSDLDTLFGGFVVEVSMHMDASPGQVWDLVTDVSRVPEFSPEVVRTEWMDDGPPEVVVGARFAGTNKLADFEWTRVQDAAGRASSPSRTRRAPRASSRRVER